MYKMTKNKTLCVCFDSLFFVSLFLLLFMSPTALFSTIHESHWTILANFYLYL